MKVAVAGAGWFGCHIASELLSGGHDVTVFEASSEVFTGASGINQNRLHLGFHYPRSYPTREQSREGFQQFLETYPGLSKEVTNNVYAIAEESSLIDFESYKQVMDASHVQYTELEASKFGLEGVSGVLTCDERLIASRAAADHFRRSLDSIIRYNTPVREVVRSDTGVMIENESYDALISCTWGQREGYDTVSMNYESCIILMYRGPADHPAITVMDGPFFSIYPFENNLFTLTSVAHTPLKVSATFAEAQAYIDQFDPNAIEGIRELFEGVALKYYPTFLDKFEYIDHALTVKTKLSDKSDTRVCKVYEAEPRIIEVVAGKIDSIFFAADQVSTLLDPYRS